MKKDKQRENPLVDTVQTPKNESDEELYSEPDEGVEIIDMENVRQLDWMAPETLQRERRDRRKRKGVKTEIEELSLLSDSNHQGNLLSSFLPLDDTNYMMGSKDLPLRTSGMWTVQTHSI